MAQIDQKGFSEKIMTAPVSPLGQRLYVKTKYATAVASPSTLAVDPTRTQRPENEEQKIHPVYAYLYVTDREEGLVVIGNPLDSPNRPGVSTLLDGDPDNNFLERALAFNPDGLLTGAVNITLAGHYAYVLASRGSSSSTSTTRCSRGSWPPWASRTSSSRAPSPSSSATPS